MYYYIVDPQKLSQREFERVQNVLYSSLSEYRISGEVVRITGLRTIQQLVENAFAHEVKTIVAVGNDDTLHDVINAIGKRQMVLGFIPLGKSALAQLLGIGDIIQAAKTIAFRRLADLDLGIINGYYFLSKINFGLGSQSTWRNLFNLPEFEVQLSANNEFQASQKVVGGIVINNRGHNSEQENITDPNDGLLDVLLLPQLTKMNILLFRKQILSGFYENIPGASLIHVKQIEILQPAGMPLKIGERVVARTPATIGVVSRMLRMIVGRDRNF